MGDRRADAAQLSERRRSWPLVVRRARPDDEPAVVAFASGTWNGWDYLPNAWPVWIAAPDGVLLVAAPASAPDGSAPLDAEGQPLEIDQPVAVARLAMVSPTEAWLEGIRVDPRVRGMDIATDLQVAELHWAAAQRATVIRYATGARNEASHRLGARHGFELLFGYRGYWWTDDPDRDDREPSAFDAEVRATATARRHRLLDALAGEGRLAVAGDGARLWPLLSADPTFNAGWRLYEPRPWAMAELTQAAFEGHIVRGEVVVAGEAAGDKDWAIAILLREQLPGEDSSLRLAVLAGEGGRAIELVERARAMAGETLRFRVPEGSPLYAAYHERFAAAGYRTPEWTLHLLGRPLDTEHPIPTVDPARVVLADQPIRLSHPGDE